MGTQRFFFSIFILIYRKKFQGILHEILYYNRQSYSGDALVRLNLGTKKWKILSCLICLTKTKYFHLISNVLMTTILLFFYLHAPLKKRYD